MVGLPFVAATDYSDLFRYRFQFPFLVLGLMWAVWIVLNLWIWQKTKALGNLLMLIGSGALGLAWIIRSFDPGPGFWLDILALGTLTVGFFFTVKPLVAAQIAALKSKLQSATAGSKKDGSAPPPPPTAS